ncbi:MAG: ion transporter [Anaerolineae bacterium]
MASKAKKAKEEKVIPHLGYEMFIAGLSILSIFNLFALWLWASSQTIQYVLGVMNAIFLPIFLGDFFWRLSKAESKSHYFFRGFGWADLISSLPLPQVKIFRVFRLWRVARIFIEFGVRSLWRDFMRHRADNALLTVVFLVIIVIQFGAIGELYFEQYAPGGNINTASDAIWYVYVTITTVGYGDHYPVTNAGRFVGMLIMTAGVGLFGTLAGFLSTAFLSPPKEKKEEPAPSEPTDPKTYVAEIRRMLEAQEQATADLRAKLDDIDRLL